MRRCARTVALAMALFAAAGCSRCGGSAAADAGSSVVHAGTAPAAQAPQGTLPATDLRSALFLIFPEFRWSKVLDGHATLTRTFRHGSDVKAALDGGGISARPPFTVDVAQAGEQVKMSASLPLDTSTVQRLIHSPSPIGTENLSLMLPRVPGAEDVREVFELELRYESSDQHVPVLVRQLVQGLQTTGWESESALPADGGVPENAELALVNAHTGGRIEVKRRGRTVTLRYHQPLSPAQG